MSSGDLRLVNGRGKYYYYTFKFPTAPAAPLRRSRVYYVMRHCGMSRDRSILYISKSLMRGQKCIVLEQNKIMKNSQCISLRKQRYDNNSVCKLKIFKFIFFFIYNKYNS